jgi:hypothetical protein
MNAQGNAKHQAATAAAAEQVLTTRGDIHKQLAALVEVAELLERLVSTRQSVGLGFQTPEGKELANKQAAADRAAARGLAYRVDELGQTWMNTSTVLGTGQVAAPVTVPAVSAAAEILFALRHHVDRLGRRAIAAGFCLFPRLPENASTPILARRLDALVDVISNRRILEEILRDLDQLAETGRNVVDGPAKTNHPDICPWCGRHSLVIHHREPGRDTPVIRCVGTHPCECTDAWCPCHRPAPAHKRPRHEWINAGGATHTWYQLAREQAHRKELMALETKAIAALDRVKQLHVETPLQPWATACPTPTEHEHQELSEQNAICLDCPPIAQVCAHCADLTQGSDAISDWPCPTIRALDEPTDVDDDNPNQ